MDRDLQDVLRDLRMGTAQVGSPEQFFALVAPAAAAIRGSLEAIPEATMELRKGATDMREKAVELQRSAAELAERTKAAEEAARAITSSGHQMVGQIARATEAMQRSIASAGTYPQWTLGILFVLGGALAFWSYVESKELRRRFDVLEHNQLVIAQKLGISVAGATEPAGAAEDAKKVPRKRGTPRARERPN